MTELPEPGRWQLQVKHCDKDNFNIWTTGTFEECLDDHFDVAGRLPDIEATRLTWVRPS